MCIKTSIVVEMEGIVILSKRNDKTIWSYEKDVRSDAGFEKRIEYMKRQSMRNFLHET